MGRRRRRDHGVRLYGLLQQLCLLFCVRWKPKEDCVRRRVKYHLGVSRISVAAMRGNDHGACEGYAVRRLLPLSRQEMMVGPGWRW